MELQKCEKLAKLYLEMKSLKETLSIIQSSEFSLELATEGLNGDLMPRKFIQDFKGLRPALDGLKDELISRVKRMISDFEDEMTKVYDN